MAISSDLFSSLSATRHPDSWSIVGFSAIQTINPAFAGEEMGKKTRDATQRGILTSHVKERLPRALYITRAHVRLREGKPFAPDDMWSRDMVW